MKDKAIGKIALDYDLQKISVNELEKWIEDQLQKMQNCNEGLMGYALKLQKDDYPDSLYQSALERMREIEHEAFIGDTETAEAIERLPDDIQHEYWELMEELEYCTCGECKK